METKGIAAGLLNPIIEPLARCFTPTSAREILNIRATESAKRRLEELAAKSQDGTLSAEERAEYRVFVEIGDLIAVLQAKARRYLADENAR
jgi:hypothetical protein